jgi:hypothetical protein
MVPRFTSGVSEMTDDAPASLSEIVGHFGIGLSLALILLLQVEALAEVAPGALTGLRPALLLTTLALGVYAALPSLKNTVWLLHRAVSKHYSEAKS